MTNKKVETILKKIKILKTDLVNIGDMRPGSVTQQFYKRDKRWPYWQISYTRNKRSKTEYLREEFVDKVRAEVRNYKKFKILVDELIALNIELSQERLKILKSDLEN